MKHLIYLFMPTISLVACGGECPMQQQLAQTKAELAAVQQELSEIADPEGSVLIHTIYLKTKEDLTAEQLDDLKDKMAGLATLPMLRSFHIGEPAATGDPRLNDDYNFVLHMSFSSEEDLAAYQKDESHLEARRSTKDYLAGPPVVYDYWIE